MRNELVPENFLVTSTEQIVETGSERIAVIDALYRFGAGQDLSDKIMLSSAFLGDAVLDFTQPAARFNTSIPKFNGREDVITNIRANLSGIETTHTFSNERIVLREEIAYLQALCEAQHVRQSDRSTLLLKNWFWCELAIEERVWKFKSMVIRNVWFTGSPEVLFPGV